MQLLALWLIMKQEPMPIQVRTLILLFSAITLAMLLTFSL